MIRVKRRNILIALAGAVGLPFAARSVAAAAAGPVADASLPAERVLGIGGLFFRSHDPKALADWYRSRLGIVPVPTGYGGASWHTEAGTTVFAPFSETTTYLGPPAQMWMVNFRVRDLAAMAAQLRALGETVTVDATAYPNGRFGRMHDPDGNPVELWQPV